MPSIPDPRPPAPTAADVHPVLAPVHDFVGKLKQEGFLPRVRAYVAWRREALAARKAARPSPPMPRFAPLSINLDLTTACNFACDHCVDWDILNRGVSHDEERLRTSLETMTAHGLRSVILIGGGEPTVYPGFTRIVRFAKRLGLQVAVVTNGSRNARILECMDVLDENDWIRLSLDAGTDATFQAMHHPKKPVALEEICGWIPRLRDANPAPRVGFSFMVTWDGARRTAGGRVVENLHEIVPAARLARASRFHYITFKPFLVRTAEGAEVIDPEASEDQHLAAVEKIRARVDEAQALATGDFAVLESTNLKLLESGDWRTWTQQPETCHMQVFRQVLSPLGLWNCPAQRGVEAGRVADLDVYAAGDEGDGAAQAVAAKLDAFDAATLCRHVTCLYHDANHWFERMIEDPDPLAADAGDPGEDYFL